MKILHTVEFYYPSVGGTQEVVKQLSERLVKLGHDVTVATAKIHQRDSLLLNGVKIEEFDIKGNLVNGIQGNKDDYLRYLSESDFDIITNFGAQQWATDLCLDLLPKLSAKKVFVPTGFSTFYFKEFEDYFTNMRKWMHYYDSCVFLSNNYRDINFAREIRVKNIQIIPNAADFEEFSYLENINSIAHIGVPEKSRLIIHLGTHTRTKGQKDALRIFLKAKITNYTLLFITDNPKIIKNYLLTKKYKFKLFTQKIFAKKHVLITSLSRAETITALRKADILLFPSMIECSPLVLFESAAAGTPFLSTDVGNSAEIIEWLGCGDLMPTIKDNYGYSKADINKSAVKLEMMLNSPITLKNMGRNGMEAVKIKYNWQFVTETYQSLYQAISNE